jgi:ABC-2 type transport system permease protein
MRALIVARKGLVELLREPQLLLLVVLVPVGFLGITAFGYSSPLLVTHPVLVMSPDPDLQNAPLTALIEELEAQRYIDGRPVFAVSQTTDPEGAEVALKKHTVTALVTLSTDGPTVTTVTIRGDALHPRFYRVSVLLENVVYNHVDRAIGRPEIVRIVERPIGAASPQTEFDVYTPGMIMFALMMIIPQTAMLVAREIRWDTLRRMRLTRLRAWELLGGMSLAQLAVAVVQVVLIFVGALLMGFHNHGSLPLATVVGLIISLSAIGLGLVVACFIENDSQAINVGSTVTMLQVFVSGAIYQLPPMTVFTLCGHQIDLFDVFPATHGLLALQQVLSHGAGLRDVGFRLMATLVLSLLYFGVGAAVFQRLQMRDSV